MFCVSIKEDMSWTLSSCGIEITSSTVINSLPSKLDTVTGLLSTLSKLNDCHICPGNGDKKFQKLLGHAIFLKNSGKSPCPPLMSPSLAYFNVVTYGSAYVELRLLRRPTIRHRHCECVIECGSICLPCKGY